VAVGVLALLFARGEKKAFHLPGGDGLVIFAAGVWVALLVFYRLIDNKTGATSEFQKVDYGVSWGIFVTLLCGIALAYAGQRLRAAQVAEPPMPGEGPPVPATPAPRRAGPDEPTTADRRAQRAAQRAARRRPDASPTRDDDPPTAATSIAPRRPARPEIDGGTQLSFDEQE
jgi:hypothetical protein